jgi:putative addiction module component (TIGR02574 family)
MLNPIIANELKKMSIAERILVVEDIWDNIAQESESIILTDSQKEELDRRLALYRSNPNMGSSWDEVKQRILKK